MIWWSGVMDYITWIWKRSLMLIGALGLGVSLASYPEINIVGAVISFVVMCIGIRMGLESAENFKQALLVLFMIFLLTLIIGVITGQGLSLFAMAFVLSPFLFIGAFILTELAKWVNAKLIKKY